jgi:hypothetical protein
MEHMKLTSGVLVFLLAAGSGAGLAVAGQSLAELAKKEKERQKKVKDAKVITSQDLRRGRRATSPAPVRTTPASAASGSSTAAAGEKSEKTVDEVREERRVEIQGQIDEERKVIQAVQEAMAQAQRELNDISNMTYGPRRAKLLKIVEDGQGEIAKLEKKIKDLQQQARREFVRVND